MGRKRDRVWVFAEKLNGRFKCNYCGREFAGGASRLKAHLARLRDSGILICENAPEDVRAKAKHAFEKLPPSLESLDDELELIEFDEIESEARGSRATNKINKSASKGSVITSTTISKIQWEEPVRQVFIWSQFYT